MIPNVPKPNVPPAQPPQPTAFIAPNIKHFLADEEPSKFRPDYIVYLVLAFIAVIGIIYGVKLGFDSYLSNWGLRLHPGDVVATTIQYGKVDSMVVVQLRGAAASRLSSLTPGSDTSVYFGYQKLGVTHIPDATTPGQHDSFTMKMGHLDAMRTKLLIDLQQQ